MRYSNYWGCSTLNRQGFRQFAFAVLGAICVALPAAGTEIRFNLPGSTEDLAERLKGASLSMTTAEQDATTAQDLIAAAQADYGRLMGVLYAQGHYGGVIGIRINGREAAGIPPLRAPERIDTIDINVDPGPVFRFGTASIAPLAPDTALPEDFARGAPAKGTLVKEATRAAISAWRSDGHAKAGVADQQIIADHARAALDAMVRLDPGPRLRFGKLDMLATGKPTRVRLERIRQIAGLPTGETYSPEQQQKATDRLRRTGAFRSVVLQEAETPSADGTLDIETRVVDAKRRRIGAGAELSSLEGVTLSGFWLHRNLMGGAERLRIDALVGGLGGESGGEDYRLGLRFDRPATFTADTGFFLMAGLEENNEPDYRERKGEIGAGLTHVFSDNLTAEAGLTYRFSEISDDLGKRELQHLLAPASAVWDRRNDSLNPESGLYLDLELTPFFGLDQGGSGARVHADLRNYVTLGDDRRLTVAGRAQLGSVAGAGLRDVPADMLFYSGGAGTVRGQRYQSLGIDLAPNVTVGGRSFMGFSGELRGMINDTVQAVAFADAGFVGQDALGTGTGEWHGGAGVGARYFTAVGPVRLDIATPLDSDAGQDFEIYIGIGQAF